MREWKLLTAGIGIALVIAGCERQAKPGPTPPRNEPKPSGEQGANTPPVGRNAPPLQPVPSGPAPVKFALRVKGLPETGSWKCDPQWADVNGDGHLDLAATQRLGESAMVWLGDGQGNWQSSSRGLATPDGQPCGGGLKLGDVNNDGKLDVVIGDHCNGIYVFLGDGRGGWEMATRALYRSDLNPDSSRSGELRGAEDVALGDVNGDGNLDIAAVASDSGGFAVYLGDGSGRNWKPHAGGLPNEGWANRVLLVDVNKDQALDVVAAAAEGPRVWHGDGKGNWKPAWVGLPFPQIQGLYRGICVADLNEDGWLDLIAANWVDGPEVYTQKPDGSWRKIDKDLFPKMRGGAVGVAAGDLDGDKHVDLIVSGRLDGQAVGHVYGVFALLGDGKGGFTYVEHSELPPDGLAFTWGVSVADFDKDGVPDVAAGSGGIVATDNVRTAPALQARMLVWKTLRQPGGRSAAAGAESRVTFAPWSGAPDALPRETAAPARAESDFAPPAGGAVPPA